MTAIQSAAVLLAVIALISNLAVLPAERNLETLLRTHASPSKSSLGAYAQGRELLQAASAGTAAQVQFFDGELVLWHRFAHTLH